MARGPSPPRPAPGALPSDWLPPASRRRSAVGGWPLVGLVILALLGGMAAVAFRAWEIRFWAAGVCG
jgi:hypothetical protein